MQRVSGPSVDPVTLAEAKAHLRVDHDDEDTLISGLISAAVSHFDGVGVLGRAMISQSWAQWVGPSPDWVRLRIGTFQSLTSVEYYDTDNQLQTATLGDFGTRLCGDFVEVGPNDDATWPTTYSRPDAIKITYVAGYGDDATDVPASIRQAILLTVGHWYENREAVAEGNYKALPLAVDALIGIERIGWYG